MDNNQRENNGSIPNIKPKPRRLFTKIAFFLTASVVTISAINLLITQAGTAGTVYSSALVTASTLIETPTASLEAYTQSPQATMLLVATTVPSKPAVTKTATPKPTATKTVAPVPTASASESVQVIDVSSLSSVNISWGQGLTVDSQNRPVNAINVQAKYGIYNADFIKDSSKKYIYLTFDEGYENGYTAHILDTLKAKNVPAVFFVTEPYAKNNPSLVRRMINEGHVIGNHSVTHPSAGLPSLTVEQQINEIMECHNYIKSTFGYTPYLFRFPLGKYSVQSLAIVKNCNYHSVFWSYAYADWDETKQMDEIVALDKLKTSLHSGAIYLLHAMSKTNANILGDFIDIARSKGYTFVVYSK